MKTCEILITVTDKMLDDLEELVLTGLYGVHPEDAARRLVEQGLRQLLQQDRSSCCPQCGAGHIEVRCYECRATTDVGGPKGL